MSLDCLTDIPFRIFQCRAGRDTAGQVRDVGSPVICCLFKDNRVSDTHASSPVPLPFESTSAFRSPHRLRDAQILSPRSFSKVEHAASRQSRPASSDPEPSLVHHIRFRPECLGRVKAYLEPIWVNVTGIAWWANRKSSKCVHDGAASFFVPDATGLFGLTAQSGEHSPGPQTLRGFCGIVAILPATFAVDAEPRP